MNIETDHSTPRQYAEGVSPLTQVREYPMIELTQERRDHLRDRTAHNVNGTNCVPINRGELRALLDIADKRDRLKDAVSRLSEQRYRYRDLLESAEDVLRNAELDSMADRIENVLEFDHD